MDADAVLERALVLHARGDTKPALKLFKWLEQQSCNKDERSRALFYQASCYSRMGDLKAARKCTEQGEVLDPADRSVRALLMFSEATIRSAEGEYSGSASLFQQITHEYEDVVGDPQFSWFRQEIDIRLAIALVQSNQLDFALPILTELLKGELEEDNWQEAKLNLALIWSRMGKQSEAEVELLNFLTKFPTHVRARYQLANVYVQQNRLVEAKQQLELCRHAVLADDPVLRSYIDQMLQNLRKAGVA